MSEPFQTSPGEVIRGLTLQLTRPGAVRGRVVDERGEAIAGHQVRANAADGRANRYYDPTTMTNAEGRFELRFVRPGRQFIQVAPFRSRAEKAPKDTVQIVEISPGDVLGNILLTQERE